MKMLYLSPKSKFGPHHHSSSCCLSHLVTFSCRSRKYNVNWNCWCSYGHLLSTVLEIICFMGCFYWLLTFQLSSVFLQRASALPSQMLYLHFTNNHHLSPFVILFQIGKFFSSTVSVLQDIFLSLLKSVVL